MVLKKKIKNPKKEKFSQSKTSNSHSIKNFIKIGNPLKTSSAPQKKNPKKVEKLINPAKRVKLRVCARLCTCSIRKKKILDKTPCTKKNKLTTPNPVFQVKNKNIKIKFISCIVAKAISFLISVINHIRIDASKEPQSTMPKLRLYPKGVTNKNKK